MILKSWLGNCAFWTCFYVMTSAWTKNEILFLLSKWKLVSPRSLYFLYGFGLCDFMLIFSQFTRWWCIRTTNSLFILFFNSFKMLFQQRCLFLLLMALGAKPGIRLRIHQPQSPASGVKKRCVIWLLFGRKQIPIHMLSLWVQQWCHRH